MVHNCRKRSKSNVTCKNSCSYKKTSQNSNRKWRVSSPSSDRTSVSTKSLVLTTSSSSRTNSKRNSWTGKSPSSMTDLIWVTKRKKLITLRSSMQSHWNGWKIMMLKSIRDGSWKWKQRKLNNMTKKNGEWRTLNMLNWQKDWGNNF